MRDARTGLRVRRPLTDEEVRALTWWRSSGGAWRKRLKCGLREHMSRLAPCPTYYPRRAKVLHRWQWRRWYFRPFGDENLNTMYNLVRDLVRGGVV